jgi:hypothetical protein
MLMLL